MFKEPVLVVKSRRGSSQQQQQQLSGSLVSAVLDSASSASPRIYPLDPEGSIELVDTHNSLQHLHNNSYHNNTNGAYPSVPSIISPSNSNRLPSNGTTKGHPKSHNHHNQRRRRSSKRNELCLSPATAPPYPHVHHQQHHHNLGSGTFRESVASGTTSTTTNSPSPTTDSGCVAEQEAQILPESQGIGRRLLNGFYDEFLDGLPFRRQPASNYCDPPARRYSLMGRAGTARNSEFKRNPIAQHRQR